MKKNMSFFQEFFKSNSAEAIEDYKNLKENIDKPILKAGQNYQYAEIRVQSRK